MKEIRHHISCNTNYPEKPGTELPQATTTVDLGGGVKAIQCNDCGAHVLLEPEEEEMAKKAQHPNTPHSTISGPAANEPRVFFSQTHELAQMFTGPAWHNRDKVGKYLDGGLKPIEAFCNDIQRNLVCWAIEGETIFYRTSDFWYAFQLVDASEFMRDPSLTGEIVWMARHRNSSSERLDDWANPHSVEHIGRGFLLGCPDKRVSLFNRS